MLSTEEMEKLVKRGNIVLTYRRPGNAEHHSTAFGMFITWTQFPFYEPEAATTTHASLVSGIEHQKNAPSGFIPIKIWQTFRGDIVHEAYVERDYAIDLYALDPHVHLSLSPDITGAMLSAKAHEIAATMKGIPYSNINLLNTFITRHSIDDVHYVEWLVDRFGIDFENKTIRFKPNEAIMCVELVILSYQIAWVLLEGPSSVGKHLPDPINVHCFCSPAEFKTFLDSRHEWKRLSPSQTHQLRYSGTRHEKDPEIDPPYVPNAHELRLSQSFCLPTLLNPATVQAIVRMKQ